jgi:hypothetical protein
MDENIPADSIVTGESSSFGVKSLFANGKIGEMGKRKGPSFGGHLNFVTDWPISDNVKREGAATMNVTLSLNPEVEKGLIVRARARGVLRRFWTAARTSSPS